MKKPAVGVLVLLTSVFAAFTAGFFVGRHLNRAPVRIWQPAVQDEDLTTESDNQDTFPIMEPIFAETPPQIVNINTATVQDLENLPGIGPVMAQRIVDYRDAHGPFQTVEELTKVKGIGENKLEELLDLITTGGET